MNKAKGGLAKNSNLQYNKNRFSNNLSVEDNIAKLSREFLALDKNGHNDIQKHKLH